MQLIETDPSSAVIYLLCRAMYPKHHVFALIYHLEANRVGETYLFELKELYNIMVTQR